MATKKETKKVEKPVKEVVKSFGVVTKRLNFREKPSLEAEILAILEKGTRVEYSKTKDKNWYKITIDGNTGYAMSEFIEDIK